MTREIHEIGTGRGKGHGYQGSTGRSLQRSISKHPTIVHWHNLSLLIISARRKSREPNSRLEHPEIFMISDHPPRQFRNPPKQFSDELAEIYSFVRDKVKGQFTSVPAAPLSAHAFSPSQFFTHHWNSASMTSIGSFFCRAFVLHRSKARSSSASFAESNL